MAALRHACQADPKLSSASPTSRCRPWSQHDMSGLLSRLSACYLQAASLPLVARATRESGGDRWLAVPSHLGPSYRYPPTGPVVSRGVSIKDRSVNKSTPSSYTTHTPIASPRLSERNQEIGNHCMRRSPAVPAGFQQRICPNGCKIFVLFLCFHQRRHDVALVAPIRDACLCTVLNYWRHLPLQPIVIFVKYFWQFVWS